MQTNLFGSKKWVWLGLVPIIFMAVFLPVIAPAAPPGDYIIGIGDNLSISVWGQKDLSAVRVTVRPDGKISFPLIKDEILADGLTPLQLKELLTQKLAEFINNPEVTVTLVETQANIIYVYGNVPGAGVKKIPPDINLLQFFSQFGHIPDNVDLRESFIVRKNKKLDVNLAKLLQEYDLSQNEILRPGDTIFFKERPKSAAVTTAAPPKDLFAEKIRVIGEVERQGTFDYKEGMTILDAILQTGGFTPYANPNKTKLVRRKGNKIEEILIDMEAVKNGEIDKNIKLEPGDVVSVPASMF